MNNTQITISCWNIKHLSSISSNGYLTNYVNKTKPDILCLSETRSSDIPLLGDKYTYYMSNVKTPLTMVCTSILPKKAIYNLGVLDNEGRYIEMHFDTFILIFTYVPYSGREKQRLAERIKFDQVLHKHIINLKEKGNNVIWCGDLNVVHQEIDIFKKYPFGNNALAGCRLEEREAFESLIQHGFIDVLRTLYPKKEGLYTWWWDEYRTGNKGWRLDYFIVNESFLKRIIQCKTKPNIMGSDHCPIELLFGL